MEFKQKETKAALSLIDKLQGKLLEAEKSAKIFIDLFNEKGEEQHDEWSTGFWMEAELIRNNINRLKRDIENQSFDF